MLLLVAFVPSKMPAAMRLSVLNVSLTQSINLQAVSALTCKKSILIIFATLWIVTGIQAHIGLDAAYVKIAL